MAIIQSYDGVNRRIYLDPSIADSEWLPVDLFKEYLTYRRDNDQFKGFEPLIRMKGGEPKGGGKAAPRFLQMLTDRRGITTKFIVPNIGPYRTKILGEISTDVAETDPEPFDVSNLTTAVVIDYKPPAAEVIVVDSIAKALDYGGILHYDENNTGTDRGAGQFHPIGTAANPVNNVADAIAIASEYFLRDISIYSDITLDRDLNGFNIRGAIPGLTFYPNGFKGHMDRFVNLILDGDFNDSLVRIRECNIVNALNIYGGINDSFHSGLILIAAGENLNMTDCESGIAGTGSPTIDMHAGETVSFSSRGFSGGQTILNCDTPGDVATLSFLDGGKPHLEPSCTDGYLSVRGVGYEDDRSNGSSIDYTAWFNPTTNQSLIQSIKDVLEGDVIPQPTRFRILHKITKAIIVDKTATEVDSLTQLTE